MPDDYLSFEDALRQLQVEEAELRALVSQGRLRAFRDENTLKFRRSDVEALRAQRETEPTAIIGPEEGEAAAAKTDETLDVEPDLAATPVAEEPIDLLGEDVLDYDDTSETIIGGDLEEETAETELGAPEAAEARDEPSTKIPTIELTPTEPSTEETAVPTLEIGEDLGPSDTDAETEVPTMVLGLDEYDDTQVATEEVATEEVFIDEEELEEAAPTADVESEEAYVPPQEEREAARSVTGTGSSGYGTGYAARVEPSPLFTTMCAIAAVILLIPGGIFFYCLISGKVPQWEFLNSVMEFFWEQFRLPRP